MVVIFDSNCRKMPDYQIAHLYVEDDFTKEDLTHQMVNDQLVGFNPNGTFAKAIFEIDNNKLDDYLL